jgi:hypothetical protein
MTATGAIVGSPLVRLLRSAGVLAVFALVGPAAGGALAYCAVVPIAMLFGINLSTASADDGSTGLSSLLGLLPVFVMMAYAFGGPQAVLTGLWASIATWLRGGISRRATVVAATLATLAWVAVAYSPVDPLNIADPTSPNMLSGAIQMMLAITPIGIACALICRTLCGVLRLTGPPT